MNITVPVEDVSDCLFLRQAIATAEYEGQEICFDIVIPDGSPYIRVGKRAYMIPMQDLVEAIIALDKEVQ